MTTSAAAALLNLLGYITGLSLYTMLLVMLMSGPRVAVGAEAGADADKTDRLPLLTALLGLGWNLGALLEFGIHNFGGWRSPALLGAAAFTALGFLPAVVVHSVLRSGEAWRHPMAMVMLIAAYSLSATASALHLYQAFSLGSAPSHWALHILTIGFAALILALLVITRGRPGWGRTGWVVALAVFAVSALHLSHHEGREYSWWIELAGHHASLPLVVVILYQDYRFALADIFLKRALSLVLLVALAFGLYLNIAVPMLNRRGADPVAIVLLLGLWVATALVYPWLRSGASWFVDMVVLRRTDYEALRAEISHRIALVETPEQILDEACARLAEALTAREASWSAADYLSGNGDNKPGDPLLPQLLFSSSQTRSSRRLKEPAARATTILAPTAEPPQYRLTISDMAGGRRLMSDDAAFLEAVAVMVARRIDAVRVIHERCARDLREQETIKLATEAELRALRAQVNPHFLFNALTTIGYLIQTAPDRAFETLMRLTQLLRGVLRRSEGEFTTLGEEIELIESYLEIERARFEDRLRVTIDAARELRTCRIPALLVQPLVENAIKHGISPSRAGGEVVISARIAPGAAKIAPGDATATAGDRLQIRVRDTGLGVSEQALAQGRSRGVGLSNVERRLKTHYGGRALFSIHSAPGAGTTVELSLPVNLTHAAAN